MVKKYRPRKVQQKRLRRRRAPNPLAAGANLAYKAWTQVQSLKRLVNVEKHEYINSSSSNVATSTALVLQCSNIAIGDTTNTRTGNSIKPLSLQLKYQCYGIPAQTLIEVIRIIVCIEKQQIPETTSYPAFYTPAPWDFLNLLTYDKGRFSIIYDKTFNNNPLSNLYHDEDVTISLSGHITYNGSASTDIEKNGIHVFAIGNQSSNPSLLNVQTLLKFTDN